VRQNLTLEIIGYLRPEAGSSYVRKRFQQVGYLGGLLGS
jgi:hypothetical protein